MVTEDGVTDRLRAGERRGVRTIGSREKGGASAFPTDGRNSVEVSKGVLRALTNTGITVFYQTPDLAVVWGHNVPASWSGGDISGKTDGDFLPAHGLERILTGKKAVLATGTPEKLEFRDVDDGGRWFDMWIDADAAPDGSVRGLVTTVVEITDRKHREQTLRTLLREVSHRSKNLLAIIQSIATQTGRYSTTIDTFLDRFRGRLQSLASSQDLVTSSNWRGAMLSELVQGQVERFRGEADDGVRFEGVDVYLNPNAALHVGLALHELVVNSMSHGALARTRGHVRLTSSMVNGPQEPPRLVLLWSERTNTPDGQAEKRFGSVALERVVPLSIDGTAVFELHDGQLDYRLEVPAENFEVE